MLLGRAPSRYKYRGSKSVLALPAKSGGSSPAARRSSIDTTSKIGPAFDSPVIAPTITSYIRYGAFNVFMNVPSPCSEIQYVPAWARRAGKTSSNIAKAIPGFKLDDIQSYVALAACVGTFIVSSKYRKFGTFSLACALGSCSPAENWFKDTFRANELSARKLEGGLVKWKQRNKYDILCLCFCVQLAAQLCADE